MLGVEHRDGTMGWAVVALDVNVDTTTPSGEMVAGVTAVVAQYERRLIGQRTRDGLAIKRAHGVRLGRRSELPRQVVSRIVQERAEGRSLRAIADELNRTSVPTGQGQSGTPPPCGVFFCGTLKRPRSYVERGRPCGSGSLELRA